MIPELKRVVLRLEDRMNARPNRPMVAFVIGKYLFLPTGRPHNAQEKGDTERQHSGSSNHRD